MAKNYQIAEPQKVLEHNQKRLIPVNIAIMLVSLLAALTLFFAPLVTIDVGLIGEKMTDIVKDNDTSENSTVSDTLSTVMKSLDGLKLSLSVMDVTTLAFSDDPVEFVSDYTAGAVEQIADNLIGSAATVLIPQLVESSGADVDTENLDVDKIIDKFDDLVNATTPAQQDQAIENLAKEIQAQAVSSDGTPLISDYADIEGPVREIYQQAQEELRKTGEKMSTEALICITISKFMNESNGSQSAVLPTPAVSSSGNQNGNSQNAKEDKVYTNYEDLVNGLLNESGNSDSSSGGIAETLQDVQPYLKYAAYALWVFPGLYVLLFLFALLHTFIGSKRVCMWYVKAFGFIPCLLFGVAPLIAGPIMKSLHVSSQIIAMLGAIATTTWISGACYLVLWIISIFWAFPIKRKIRHAKQQIKYNRDIGLDPNS